MRLLKATALLVTAALACACGPEDQPVPGTPSAAASSTAPPAPPSTPASGAASSAPPSAPVAAAGSHVSEGMVGANATNPFRIEVRAVERHAELTVLRMEIMTTATSNAIGDFGYGILPASFARFRLLDPVGRKVYFTLRENDGDGEAFGTRHLPPAGAYPDDFLPGVRYPVEVYFPPLPATAEAVSIVPDMPMGPMTGIPVTDGGAEPAARERDSSEPKAGDTFQWPVVVPNGKIWSGVSDLNELVETPVKSTTREGDKETIGLRTDVLFAFDEARLSAKAAAVLDDVAEETRRRADPAKPPITIIGHTDDKGDDGYNQTLSVRRARAVQEYLAARLGTDYQYKPEGKGESEPIAKNQKKDGSDDPAGRARNRRVEISYSIKKQGPDVTTTTDPSTDRVRGSTVAPAPFRADPGARAAGFTWSFRNQTDQLKVDVLPLYRDGAYVVASFDITKVNKGTFIPVPDPFSGWDHEFSSGSDFGAFILVDPATKARYHPLKMYTEFVENYVPALEEGETGRAYVYYPAPPDDRTSITLEVLNGGAYPGIPIGR
ncbi:OmpA family protein [Streptosporangium sp. NPDC048047]|uniref:OmpA family protein n=1 Tax=Streptosporangium sp. NPDC048047 TaxID=3155748 RepID=UPI003444939E